MVAILLEPEYAGSVWGKNLYRSLVQQLRQKRIPFCEIADSCPGQAEVVFVIAANFAWTKAAILQLNQGGHRPILICNQYERIPGCLYSCVCSDVSASMRDLLEVLKDRKQTRVALYGMGNSSIADLSRANSLFCWLDERFASLKVFDNEGSLAECFEGFFPHCREFDAVICANDYAAVSLVRQLRQRDPECLQQLSVISCAGTRISGFYREAITSLGMNFEPYGRAALYIYECMQRDPFVSGMTVNIKWSPDTEAAGVRQETELAFPEQPDVFYSDPEIRDMLIVDKYLSVSESVDRDIFAALLQGQTYQKIAEQCFLTEGTVKYRIKRLVQLCGAADKTELLELLGQYL